MCGRFSYKPIFLNPFVTILITEILFVVAVKAEQLGMRRPVKSFEILNDVDGSPSMMVTF
jgi:hypothetical protein